MPGVAGAVTFDLPYPPTVNTYWRRHGNQYYIAGPGKRFRRDTFYLIKTTRPAKLAGLVALAVDLYPPDKRRRDIDNVLKPVLDCLQHAGVLSDDYQVAEIMVKRHAPTKGGGCRVTVSEITLS